MIIEKVTMYGHASIITDAIQLKALDAIIEGCISPEKVMSITIGGGTCTEYVNEVQAQQIVDALCDHFKIRSRLTSVGTDTTCITTGR